MQNLKPMDAVAALYSAGQSELAGGIMDSLSHAIFHGNEIRTAGKLQKAMARLSYRILKLTTKLEESGDGVTRGTQAYRNRFLERSGHPYARSLLDATGIDTSALVEGGDPMNAPYMMLLPAIRRNGQLWDRLFFESVQSRDVQSRMVWETLATHEAAARRLKEGRPVRLKAVAAGTGLSMILAYDKLIREGFDPTLITAEITDRDPANVAKANRLLDKLPTTAGSKTGGDRKHGISAHAEDIFTGKAGQDMAVAPFDIITAIGILEYFPGFSYATTEQRLKLAPGDETVTAQHLVERLAQMTVDDSNLIINTYRDDASTRILELFGKRFDYRRPEDLRALLASSNFRQTKIVGSGNIYDVKVYEKHS